MVLTTSTACARMEASVAVVDVDAFMLVRAVELTLEVRCALAVEFALDGGFVLAVTEDGPPNVIQQVRSQKVWTAGCVQLLV